MYDTAGTANTVISIVFSAAQLPVKLTGMQSLASKMWLPWLAMGLMIVVAAFVIGLFNSATAADYFTASKEVREAAVRGSDLATDRAFIESTKVWLPAFKFLGIGMLLGGITFLLATILGNLRTGGARVQEALGAEVRVLKPPMTATLFPMLMMMGVMILVASLVIAIVTSTLSYDYWNHSIATQLNPAEGSLLADLGTINAITLWLAPFKFVGLALLFTGIGLALATIVRVLRWQSQRLWELLGADTISVPLETKRRPVSLGEMSHQEVVLLQEVDSRWKDRICSTPAPIYREFEGAATADEFFDKNLADIPDIMVELDLQIETDVQVDESTLALMGLYPSRALRSIPAQISLVDRRIRVTIDDPLVLLDPDEDQPTGDIPAYRAEVILFVVECA